MDLNGFSTDNTHDGTVFVFGDMNIEGNLTVGGTYPGGGGSVNNPMTSNLDANNYEINNVAKITSGSYPQILMGEINLQNNTIRNVNQIEVNDIYSSTGQILLGSNLDAGNFNITNVNTLEIDKLTTDNKTPFINCDGKILDNLSAIRLINGLYFSASIVPEENYVLTVAGGSTIIDYKKAVFNPVEEDINANNHLISNISELSAGEEGFIKTGSLDLQDNNIINVNTIETKEINSQTGFITVTSVLNMFNDINMDDNDIFNVERLTGRNSDIDLNLDMIPATEGKASQVLARNPAFDPLNSNTHKLVWQTPSGGGGGITNPLTANIMCAGYSILEAKEVECKGLSIIVAGGYGISSNAGGVAVPITWGLALKLSTAPFYQTFNTDYITPATAAGVTIDSKLQDGITDSKITLSAPNIILNNSTNLAPSLVSITGNIQITNGSGYIHGNNLIVRGRNSSAVPTPITIEGTTTSINSSTLNITSSTSNNFLGAVNTNFSGTVKTNFIDANSGGNISILQNLTLAVGKFLQTPQIFTDAVRSNTNTDLIIAGFLPDNKTQTNIILASPQISLNNQFGPLTADTQVNITGNIIFNNPVTNPFIHGSNLFIRGRTPAGVATPITIEGTTTTINSSTLTIYSTLANNIGGPTNFTGTVKVNNIQNYTGTNLNLTATDVNISNHLNVLTYSNPYNRIYP